MAARIPQQNVILRAPTQANRRPLDTFPAYMRQLGQTVLDGHHDIKFHKGAEQRATAASWTSRRGLTLGPDVDINDDGVNDVVLYTREGVSVVINLDRRYYIPVFVILHQTRQVVLSILSRHFLDCKK